MGSAWNVVSDHWPTAYVFLALIAIAVSFLSVADMSADTRWLLLVVFSTLALIPDTGGRL
jgi:hypothetical protein